MMMISICRGNIQVVSKAADILIQLYQTNQPSEVNLITQSLGTLIDLNIGDFLKSFFANFEDGNELVRERALKFLTKKIQHVNESQLTQEVENLFLEYATKAMQDVNKDEFISFIQILNKLKVSRRAKGQQTLFTTIKAQADLDKDFNPNDSVSLDKFLLCAKQTQPFLSIFNRASEYVNYICLKILPHLESLEANGTDLTVLQVLAEMSPNLHTDDIPTLLNLEECHKSVHKKLMEFLPMPEVKLINLDEPANASAVDSGAAKEGAAPASDDPAAAKPEELAVAAATPAGATGEKKSDENDFQFTKIEFLMYTLMQLDRLKPELYTEAMQAESRKQLQHLSNGCKKYTDALESQLKKSGTDQDLRRVALRTTKNISAMIIGLFRRPVDFRVVSTINLSCKPVVVATPPAATGTTKTTPATTTTTSRPSHSNNNNNNNNKTKHRNFNHNNNNNNNNVHGKRRRLY